MDKLVGELCEILEVTALEVDARFEDMPEWDSLNALSVIALLDSNYGLQIDATGLQNFKNIIDFLNYVLTNKKK
jgi:acyl carrier protein